MALCTLHLGLVAGLSVDNSCDFSLALLIDTFRLFGVAGGVVALVVGGLIARVLVLLSGNDSRE